MNIQTMSIKEILDSALTISIVSGEGAIGDREEYTGLRSIRALKARLTRERCHGDRWARAEVLVHPETDDAAAVYFGFSL